MAPSRLDGAICEHLVGGNYIALDECKTKQSFVVSKWGKGDSYVGGLDVSLKNWTLNNCDCDVTIY